MDLVGQPDLNDDSDLADRSSDLIKDVLLQVDC